MDRRDRLESVLIVVLLLMLSSHASGTMALAVPLLVVMTTGVSSFDTVFSPALPPSHLNMYFNTVDGSFGYVVDDDVAVDDVDDDLVVVSVILDSSHSFIR